MNRKERFQVRIRDGKIAFPLKYDPFMLTFLEWYGHWSYDVIPTDKFEERRCFQNSFDFARFSEGELRYCEGLSFLGDDDCVPEHHAWCAGLDRAVRDFTWQPHGDAYFGVCFRPDFISTWPDEVGYDGLLREQNLRRWWPGWRHNEMTQLPVSDDIFSTVIFRPDGSPEEPCSSALS